MPQQQVRELHKLPPLITSEQLNCSYRSDNWLSFSFNRRRHRLVNTVAQAPSRSWTGRLFLLIETWSISRASRCKIPDKQTTPENLQRIIFVRDRKRFYPCLDSIKLENLAHGNRKPLIPIFYHQTILRTEPDHP